MHYIASMTSALEVSAATGGSVISVTVVLGALIIKLADLVKYLVAFLRSSGDSRAEAANGIVTLALSAVAGIVAVLWFQGTNWADEIMIGDETFADLSIGSTIVLGVVATSLASTLYDFKKALDNTDTASTPKLIPAAENARRERLRNALRP